jgi:hypothetical protein
MRRSRWVVGSVGAILVALQASFAQSPPASAEKVPLYTNADLDRMFGPSTPPAADAGTTAPTPEEWSWVERFLDRQYARIDADRRNDLDRQAADAETSVVPASPYGNPIAWRLGYPSAAWWNTVWWEYSRRHGSVPPPSLNPPRPAADPHRRPLEHAHGSGHGDQAGEHDSGHGHGRK